jgi:hypothetical protein
MGSCSYITGANDESIHSTYSDCRIKTRKTGFPRCRRHSRWRRKGYKCRRTRKTSAGSPKIGAGRPLSRAGRVIHPAGSLIYPAGRGTNGAGKVVPYAGTAFLILKLVDTPVNFMALALAHVSTCQLIDSLCCLTGS